jgi:transcription-repair coupling factor (superfamily II helicase)
VTNASRSPAELLAPGRPLTLANVAEGAEGLVLSDLARAIAAKPNAPPTSLVVICRDGQRMALLARALSFFARRWNFRRGIASPMTGCRRIPVSWPSA